MVDYREILRLHNLGYSQRVITSSVHSSRSTVKEVIDLANALKIEWPLDANVTNSDLELLLYPARAEKNSNRMPIDFPWIHRELAKKGVTMTLLWTEYCEQAYAAGKQPYMSTQFGDLYRKWARVSKATMRISESPGETFEVDWAGATVDNSRQCLPAKSLRLISSWEYCLAAACICGTLPGYEVGELYPLPCPCL